MQLSSAVYLIVCLVLIVFAEIVLLLLSCIIPFSERQQVLLLSQIMKGLRRECDMRKTFRPTIKLNAVLVFVITTAL